MLKKVLVAVAALIALLLLVIATRPATYRVERSTKVEAPPDVVFAMVSDFRQWGAWSPWEKLDPSMKKTFEGPTAAEGSVTTWSGNDKVGEGKMTLTSIRPNERIDIKLEFIKPWASTNSTEFLFKPDGQATQVSWIMSGNHNFMGKATSLFMDFDSMLGKDFEAGLASLKSVAEAEAKKQAETEAKRAAEAAAAAPANPGEPANPTE